MQLESSSPTKWRSADSSQPMPDFFVRFWGVRGSCPSPGVKTSWFGGNTPCVEVNCGGEILVFDLGTGACVLGKLLRDSPRVTIFLSHYHHDHIHGLPFFTPMFDARSKIVVYGPAWGGRDVKGILSEFMTEPYFPAKAERVFQAQVDYRTFGELADERIGGARVSACPLAHPGGSTGYRVDYRGHSVVYATDVEQVPSSRSMGRMAAFAERTDLLIHDAMYTEEEYDGRPSKRGWGHSTWKLAAEAADQARARKLLLFHHAPGRSDADVKAIASDAMSLRPDVEAAREGECWKLEGGSSLWPPEAPT